MSADLSQITRNVLARVESLSGFPVHVREEPSLGSLSSHKLASGGKPVHVVNYHPSVAILAGRGAAELPAEE